MGLELPGIETIETPERARAVARRWNRMAAEIDTPDAPDEAKAKARELRQRAEAAYRWARQQEHALDAGHQAAHSHESARKVVPIRPSAEGDASPLDRAATHRLPAAARAAAHDAYRRSKPPAMRIVDRGKHHFFQGASEPFGPLGSGYELLFEALGLTLAIVLLTDLVRAPGVIGQVSTHGLGFLRRAASLADPITGLAPATTTAASSPARPHSTTVRA